MRLQPVDWWGHFAARYNGQDMPMERTLVLLKPDAMQRGLAGEIISRLEGRGLRIVAARLLQIDGNLAARHYAEHVEKPFYESLVSFITACPIVAAVFEGPNAVELVRATWAPPTHAKPRRAQFAGTSLLTLRRT